eukprot:6181214-Pleurochrysis_carterae.AAC.1
MILVVLSEPAFLPVMAERKRESSASSKVCAGSCGHKFSAGSTVGMSSGCGNGLEFARQQTSRLEQASLQGSRGDNFVDKSAAELGARAEPASLAAIRKALTGVSGIGWIG